MEQTNEENTPSHQHSASKGTNQSDTFQHQDSHFLTRRLRIDPDVCYFCKRHVGAYSNEPATIDHLTPKSKGGIRSKKNTVPACFDCNQLKGDLTVDEFYVLVQALLRTNKSDFRKKEAYLLKIMSTVNALLAHKRKAP